MNELTEGWEDFLIFSAGGANVYTYCQGSSYGIKSLKCDVMRPVSRWILYQCMCIPAKGISKECSQVGQYSQWGYLQVWVQIKTCDMSIWSKSRSGKEKTTCCVCGARGRFPPWWCGGCGLCPACFRPHRPIPSLSLCLSVGSLHCPPQGHVLPSPNIHGPFRMHSSF